MVAYLSTIYEVALVSHQFQFSVGIHCRTGQSLCCVIKTLVFVLSATSHLFYLQEDTDTPRISGTHSPNLDSFPVIFLLKVGFWTPSHHNHFKDHHHDYQYHADPYHHSSQTEARILEKHLMESSSLSIAIQVELVMVVVSMMIRVMMMMVMIRRRRRGIMRQVCSGFVNFFLVQSHFHHRSNLKEERERWRWLPHRWTPLPNQTSLQNTKS